MIESSPAATLSRSLRSTVTFEATGLEAGTEYEFRVSAASSTRNVEGETQTFETQD